jgi:hypothetical protein
MAQAAPIGDWQDWDGGECPCPVNRVQVQFRCDASRDAAEKVSGERGNHAHVYKWSNTGSAGDIVAFRVVG